MMSHEPATPSAMPLHTGLCKGSSNISEDEAEATDSMSSGICSSNKASPDPVSIPAPTPNNSAHNPSISIHRIREYKRRKRQSMREYSSVGEEEKSPKSGVIRSISGGMEPQNNGGMESLNSGGIVRSNIGQTINRIREYQKKKRENIGEQETGVIEGSGTWQRHVSTRRLDQLSENSNEVEPNPLRSPRSSLVSPRSSRNFGSGTSSRRLRTGSGTSTRRLTSSCTSTRSMAKGTGGLRSSLGTRESGGFSSLSPRPSLTAGGASTRSMAKGTVGASTRRLSWDSGSASTRDIGWSQNSSHRSSLFTRPSLAQTNSVVSSDHRTASSSTHSTRSSLSQSQHGLSRTEQRRLQLNEQKNAHAASVGENLLSNTNVKGTTLELLALIKKRRQARARGRDIGAPSCRTRSLGRRL